MQKTLVFTGMVIGSYIGSCIPLLWDGSLLSMNSILLSGLGGIFGIFIGYRFSKNF